MGPHDIPDTVVVPSRVNSLKAAKGTKTKPRSGSASPQGRVAQTATQPPRRYTPEEIEQAAADARQALLEPRTAAARARDLKAMQSFRERLDHDLMDIPDDLDIPVPVTDAPKKKTTKKKGVAAKKAKKVVQRIRNVVAVEMEKARQRLSQRLAQADLPPGLIPVVRLEACAACDFCILFTTTASVDKYFLPVVTRLSTTGMRLTHDRKGEASYTTKTTSFSLEAVAVNSAAVSLHVRLRKDAAPAFLTYHVDKFIRHAMLAVDSQGEVVLDTPYPANTATLNEAQRLRVIYIVLNGLLHHAGVPAAESAIDIFPAHADASRDAVWQALWCVPLHRWFVTPVDEDMVLAYFGEETMFYFAWMNHYQKWLLGGGLLSLAVTILAESSTTMLSTSVGSLIHRQNGRSWADDVGAAQQVLAVLYTVIILLGSVLCVKTWERRCHTLRMRYHLFQPSAKDEPRRAFRGKPGINPITREVELQYSSWRRGVLLQPLSWSMTLLFVALTLFVTVCSLNMERMTSPEGGHRFGYIPALRRLAEPGGIFCPEERPWFSFVPSGLFAVAITVLSVVYKKMAERLTAFENYPFRGAHIRSLIQKRIVFEFVNSYAKLLFIALVRQDMQELTSALQTVFVFGVLIRFLSQTLGPFLVTHRTHFLRKIFRSAPSKSNEASGAQDKVDVARTVLRHGGSAESTLDEVDEHLQAYEVFSDIVEMVIQFGYIILFAVVFPLASLVALLSNIVEVRSDLFKLCYIVRRPVPRLGWEETKAWINIFRLVVLAAVITNTLMIMIHCNAIMASIFPSYYELRHTPLGRGVGALSDEAPDTGIQWVWVAGEGRNMVMMGVAIEHVALIAVSFLFWRIPKYTKAVKIHMERELYQRATPH